MRVLYRHAVAAAARRWLGLQRHGAIQLVELGRSLVVLVARRVQLGFGGGALAQQLLHLPHALGHAVLLFARGLQFPGEIDAVQRGRACPCDSALTATPCNCFSSARNWPAWVDSARWRA